MLLTDVNILVNAYRQDAVDHPRYAAWLQSIFDASEAFAFSDLVLSGFLRVVTHPGIFKVASPLDDALIFAAQIRDQPNAVAAVPGSRHWGIFVDLCRKSKARGKLVPDAYFAALAIESGSEWVTMDGDYGRFPGLRWRRPF